MDLIDSTNLCYANCILLWLDVLGQHKNPQKPHNETMYKASLSFATSAWTNSRHGRQN